MAAAAAAVPDPLDNARKTLARTCDALTSRSHFFPIFDESKGSAGYARWRSDLLTYISTAGVDFTAAYEYNGVITANIAYAPALVNDNTLNSVVTYTMPEMRQMAILSVIRATLSPNGESRKMIRDCRHAGGTITDPITHVDIDQARIILDRRWRSATAEVVDTGKEAKMLHSMQWPSEMTVDAYNTYFNAVVAHADKANMNPSYNDAPSVALRSSWWYVFTAPPATSPYFAAAQLARSATNQECTEVGHRNAWLNAMIREIDILVTAGHGKPSGGMARGYAASADVGSPLVPLGASAGGSAGGSYGSGAPPASFPPGFAPQPHGYAARPSAPFAPASARPPKPCGRCPKVNGAFVYHDRGFRCSTPASCDTCKANTHAGHSCYVAFGVPSDSKINVGLAAELARLHELYKAGKWDWRTTPTSIRWLNNMREAPSSMQATGLRADVESADWSGHEGCADELAAMEAMGLDESPSAPCTVGTSPG